MEALLIFAIELGALIGVDVTPKEAIMFKIMCVESAGKEQKWHADNQSWGLFGLTKKTAKWLEVDLGETPKEQYDSAEKYLDKMIDKCEGNLINAAGCYHSKNYREKLRYEDKLEDVKPEDYPEAVEVFKSIINQKHSEE